MSPILDDQALPEINVALASGERAKLSTYYAHQPLALVFVRHFG